METWGILSSYCLDGHSKLVFVQQRQDSCLVVRETLGISPRLGRAIRNRLELRRENQGHFLLATVILGCLSIFKKSQALSPFEALISTCLSMCQSEVRPPVLMRRGSRAFSMVSSGIQTNLHLVR